MEEIPENGKESSNSAHANGMNVENIGTSHEDRGTFRRVYS